MWEIIQKINEKTIKKNWKGGKRELTWRWRQWWKPWKRDEEIWEDEIDGLVMKKVILMIEMSMGVEVAMPFFSVFCYCSCYVLTPFLCVFVKCWILVLLPERGERKRTISTRKEEREGESRVSKLLGFAGKWPKLVLFIKTNERGLWLLICHYV